MSSQTPSAPPSAAALAEIGAAVGNLAAAAVRAQVGRASTLGTKSSATDVVTHTDVEVEDLVRRELEVRAPGSSLLGEEHGDDAGSSAIGWIIDPIDGTVNFLYDLPVIAVSIAATLHGDVVAGAVVDVLRDETFTAVRGGGARRDGVPIEVNAPQSMGQALLATGFSYDADLRRAQGRVLQEVVGTVRDVRCFGSAALHLCWVACGRIDGYWEVDLKVWDVAAGGLVAREAGAEVHTPLEDGGTLTLAAPPAVATPLLRLVRPADEPVGLEGPPRHRSGRRQG